MRITRSDTMVRGIHLIRIAIASATKALQSTHSATMSSTVGMSHSNCHSMHELSHHLTGGVMVDARVDAADKELVAIQNEARTRDQSGTVLTESAMVAVSANVVVIVIVRILNSEST